MSEIEQPIPDNYFSSSKNSDKFVRRLGMYNIYKSKLSQMTTGSSK